MRWDVTHITENGFIFRLGIPGLNFRLGKSCANYPWSYSHFTKRRHEPLVCCRPLLKCEYVHHLRMCPKTSNRDSSCYLATILLFVTFFSSLSKLLCHPSGTWEATAFPFHYCGHSSKGDVTDKIKSPVSSAQHLSSWHSPTKDLCWLKQCWIIWVVLWVGVFHCGIFLAGFPPTMSTHLLKRGGFASVPVPWQVLCPATPPSGQEGDWDLYSAGSFLCLWEVPSKNRHIKAAKQGANIVFLFFSQKKGWGKAVNAQTLHLQRFVLQLCMGGYLLCTVSLKH